MPNQCHATAPDIVGSVEKIPVDSGSFDSVFCNAVLEHVAEPERAVGEFYRVLKPGGYLYLCVPFMQPFHCDPSDFQRYTSEGLALLVERQGFIPIKVEPVHNVFHTVAWVVERWLESDNCLSYRVLRWFLYPVLRNRCRRSKRVVAEIASAFRVLAMKPL